MQGAEQLGAALAQNVVSYVDSAIASVNAAQSGFAAQRLATLRYFASAPTVSSTRMATSGTQLTALSAALVKFSPAQSQGMDAKTGKLLTGIDHLKQSITQILTTRVGTRVMRRSFGSTVPELLDSPLNPQTVLLTYASVAVSLREFEPRFKLSRVFKEADFFRIEGDFLGEKINADITLSF
jgi:phage baseplate assembly protein W